MFESYARLEIHEVMMRDTPRVEAYRRAVERGRAGHFEGKAVLDVGCGVGILAMLAARAGGARVVYAVEASAKTAARAREVVACNGLEGVVRVIHGRVEELDLPEKVDVVISEWMGYFLVHESMLESVLLARDRWMLPGGQMYPSRARLFLSPGNFDRQIEESSRFWAAGVCGFDFRPLQEEAEAALREHPRAVNTFKPEQMIGGVVPAVVADFDLSKCTKAEVREVVARFCFRRPESSAAAKAELVHGFALWFDVDFPSGVQLGTGPADAATHWGQTLMFLDEPAALAPGDALAGILRLSANVDNHRFYDLSIEAEAAPDPELLSEAEGAEEVSGNGESGEDWPFPISLPVDGGFAVAARELKPGEVLLRAEPLAFVPGDAGAPAGGAPLGPILLAALRGLREHDMGLAPADEGEDAEDEDQDDFVRDSWADLAMYLDMVAPPPDWQLTEETEAAAAEQLVASVLKGTLPALRKHWTSTKRKRDASQRLCWQLRRRALHLPGRGAGLYPTLFALRWAAPGSAAGPEEANCVLRSASSQPRRLVVTASRAVPAGAELVLHVGGGGTGAAATLPELEVLFGALPPA